MCPPAPCASIQETSCMEEQQAVCLFSPPLSIHFSFTNHLLAHLYVHPHLLCLIVSQFNIPFVYADYAGSIHITVPKNTTMNDILYNEEFRQEKEKQLQEHGLDMLMRAEISPPLSGGNSTISQFSVMKGTVILSPLDSTKSLHVQQASTLQLIKDIPNQKRIQPQPTKQQQKSNKNFITKAEQTTKEDTNNHLKQTVTTLRDEVTTLRDKVTTLENTMTTLTKTVNTLTNELTTLRDEFRPRLGAHTIYMRIFLKNVRYFIFIFMRGARREG